MSSCGQELCPVWNGEGCPCERFDLDKTNPPTTGIFTTETETP